MHRIRITDNGKRLEITLSGFFDMNSSNDALNELKNILYNIKPGFNVISNVKDVKPANTRVL